MRSEKHYKDVLELLVVVFAVALTHAWSRGGFLGGAMPSPPRGLSSVLRPSSEDELAERWRAAPLGLVCPFSLLSTNSMVNSSDRF